MNKSLISFGMIVLLICVGLSGCIDQNKTSDKYSEENLLFIPWVLEVSTILNDKGLNINNASINEDLPEVYNLSIKLMEEIEIYFYEINNFSLSSTECANIRNEYYLYFYEFNQYANYHGKAAKAEMEGDYNSTLSYLEIVVETYERLLVRQEKVLNMIENFLVSES